MIICNPNFEFCVFCVYLWVDYISNIKRFVRCDSVQVHPPETAGIPCNHGSLFISLLYFFVSLAVYMEYVIFQVFKFPNPVSPGLYVGRL